MYRRTFFKTLGLVTGASLVGVKPALCAPRHGNKDIIPTGIKSLDDVLGGGIHRHAHVLVTGRTGSGKTAFLNRLEYESDLHRMDWGVQSPKLTIVNDIERKVYDVKDPYFRFNSLIRFQLSQIDDDRKQKGISVFAFQKTHVLFESCLADLGLQCFKTDDGQHAITIRKNRYGLKGMCFPFRVEPRNSRPILVDDCE